MPESRLNHWQEQAWRNVAEAEKYKLAYESELYKRMPSMATETEARVIRLATDCNFLEGKIEKQDDEIKILRTENNELVIDKLKLENKIKD